MGLDQSIFGPHLPAPIFQALVPRKAGVFDEHAHTFGTINEPAAFTRASLGTYRDEHGVWQTAAVNAIRYHYDLTGQGIGYLFEPAATNLFLNSDAPATQDIALLVGEHTISVHGTGSVTSSNGTGTATGHGAASEGSDVTIDVTIGGTITFTVSGSPDYAQVEKTTFSTSPIVTAGTSVTRAVDSGVLFNTIPEGYSEANGTVIVDWMALFDPLDKTGNKPIVSAVAGAVSWIYVGLTGSDSLIKCYDGANGKSINIGATTKARSYRIATMWDNSIPRLYIGVKYAGSWSWANGLYDGSWSCDRVNMMFSLGIPHLLQNVRLFNRSITSAEIERFL